MERPDSAGDQYQQLLKEHEEGAAPRELAARFFELAERYPKDPVAVDALVWVLTKLRSRPEATRALEMLERSHLQSERLASACPAIARTPSTRAEKLLQAAVEKGLHREVRASACLHWAALLDQQATLVEQLKKQPDRASRVVQYYGKDYGKYLAALEPEKLDKKREQVYERLQKSFADVPAEEGTMGEIAERALFRIRHLTIGRVAPEIEGEDIFRQAFKLSDYRGKVVVLSFWGDW